MKSGVSSAKSGRKMKEKIIHPGSRKAAQMLRETNRTEKKEKLDI